MANKNGPPPPLSGGVISALFNNTPLPTNQVIVQLFNVKAVAAGDKVRYRAMFSDGIHAMQGMITSQLQEAMIAKGEEIRENSVVQLLDQQVNPLHGMNVLIGVKMNLLCYATSKIGDPQPIDSGASVLGAAKPTAPVAASSSTGRTMPNSFGGGQGNSFSSPMSTGVGSGSIYPIAQLNPYQNNWTIRARVTNRSDVRNYNNARGSGKLMSVDLLDTQGGEIRATMFNEQVDKFGPLLLKGSVFLISGGSLKEANRRYTNLNNQYEITFHSGTRIEPCQDAGDIKQMQYDFVAIDEIAQKQKDEIVDVMGVVINVGELGSITTKKGDQLAKRAITLLDQSSRSIELTLWGNNAENFSAAGAPVLACKGVRVSDYGNRCLSTSAGTALDLSPSLPAATTLKQWYDKQGGYQHIKIYPLTIAGGGGGGGGGGMPAPFKRLEDVVSEQIGMAQAAMFECEVMITLLRHEATWMYNACPKEDCKKKVVEDHAGGWRCEKCNHTYPECSPRYVVSMTASDGTGKLWFSLFNDEAARLLGRSAGDAQTLQQTDPKAFEKMFEDALYRTVRMRVRARAETYNQTEKIKYNVVAINAVNWAAAATELVANLEALGIAATA